MGETFRDQKERWLLTLALAALVLLLFVKIKFAVPEFMKGPDWVWLISALQSKVFEDIVGDLLTGVIAAYFFYVLIDLRPRLKRERTTLRVLNLLIASVIHSYETTHFFGHTMAIDQVSETLLAKDKVDRHLKEVKDSPNLGKLKCALFTAHSRFADFQQTLGMAATLSPERALQWLVITDKIRLLVDEYPNHPESDVYVPSQVFAEDNPELDRDAMEFIRYYSDLHEFRESLQTCFYEFLEQANKWIALENREIGGAEVAVA